MLRSGDKENTKSYEYRDDKEEFPISRQDVTSSSCTTVLMLSALERPRKQQSARGAACVTRARKWMSTMGGARVAKSRRIWQPTPSESQVLSS